VGAAATYYHILPRARYLNIGESAIQKMSDSFDNKSGNFRNNRTRGRFFSTAVKVAQGIEEIEIK
jgi:hypothetical protein